MIEEKNISLEKMNSFGVIHRAKKLISFENKDEVIRYLKNNKSEIDDILILGEGSNTLFTKDYNGIIFQSNIKGIKIIKEDNESITLKVGSGDLTFHDLIKTIAKIGKPLILSTGMSKLEEIKEACEVYFDNFIGGKNEAFRNLALLHCVSLYPTDQELVGLNQIEVLKNEFLNNVTIGYSHHCKNHDLIIYSYLLGAKVIEFHYTDNILDDSFRDNQLSLDKNLFTKINQKLEIVKCISKKEFKDIYVAQQSQGNLIDFRRSIYAAKDIKAGEILVSSDFKFLRPLTGIGVEYSKQIFDGTYSLKNDLNSDRSLEWHNIERQ